jgi:DNA-binding response OmpR family regulator
MSDKTKRIALVDDEPDILKTTSIFLKAEGFDVLTATDGITALELIKKERPDLIVLDIMLPKIDGYKICRILKFDDRYKNIPIVIFTARAQELDEKKAKEVKADAYITKPFQPEGLLGKIRQLLKLEKIDFACIF